MIQRVGPSRRSGRQALAVLLGAGLVVSACISTTDISDESSANADRSADSAPASSDDDSTGASDGSEGSTTTAEGTSNDGQAATEAPNSDGLPQISEIDSEIVRGTLDNGLRYFIRENDNPGSRVEMRLAIDAGSGLQDDDQGGGAHFLEHMLFNGTEQFPENELIAVLRSFGAAFGADINASTSSDETIYQLTMPTDDPSFVLTGLDVLQQWLTSATIDQAQVEAERGVVLDEWRRRAQSSNGRVFDEIRGFFLDGTQYEGRITIGTDEEISATSAEPLRRFYDAWYRPDNASVVVVGDIDADDIEQEIIDRFAPIVARGESPERAPISVSPKQEDRALVVTDPDLGEGFGFVTLPLAVDESRTREEFVQRSILSRLAFEIINTRLSNDALRGDAPFDSSRVDGSGFVRLLDAPEIGFSADGEDMEASIQAILDEYERVRRFGFTQQEVDRAVASRRSGARNNYDSRFSRQDSSYADEYVRHFLEGESLPTADRWFDFVNEVLDRATPATIAHMFVERFNQTGAHIFVAAPDDEADDLPTAETLVAQAASLSTRELVARADDSAIGDELMAPPEPAEVVSSERLSDGSGISFVAPTVLTFANGVRVSLNNTPITEAGVVFEARSPGGLAVVADDDVPDADAASTVIDNSGVADFDPVALEAFLSDKEVQLDADIEPFIESFNGFAATTDLETLFQLVHLQMTAPRVDSVALEQYVDNQLPLAEDPSLNPGYAQFKALTDARYDDVRFLLPTPESLLSVTEADVLRVFADRFGDASDWAFSFNGDFDIDEAAELASRYLGTLPGTGRIDSVDYVEPPAPAGVISETVQAGEGEQASVLFLFTEQATTNRRDDMTARLAQQIITARLTDKIREELGESYSPFGRFELTSGATPSSELILSISTGPDLVDSVSTAVLNQLDDLRTNGPTAVEYDAAIATIVNEVQLFSNEQINNEILSVLTDPAGNPSIAAFLDQAGLVNGISSTDIQNFIAQAAPASDYIQITVLPR